MPEGDTVFRLAHRLNAALAGQVLLVAELNVPAHASADLVGARIDEVVPLGKHLLMRMHQVQERLTLHSHLRMDGRWSLVSGGPRPADADGHHVRALLGTREWWAIGTLLGELDLVRTDDEARVVGHLGPDLLDADLDMAEVRRRVAQHSHRAVAEVLRDQSVVAGLGNELVSEVLFLRGLNPWTPVGTVDVDALCTLAVKLIRANSTRDVRSSTGDLRRGRTSYVFNRGGRACRRCGTTIRSREQGDPPRARTSWWCPACQPATAAGE